MYDVWETNGTVYVVLNDYPHSQSNICEILTCRHVGSTYVVTIQCSDEHSTYYDYTVHTAQSLREMIRRLLSKSNALVKFNSIYKIEFDNTSNY
jgi:hypothetical protein